MILSAFLYSLVSALGYAAGILIALMLAGGSMAAVWGLSDWKGRREHKHRQSVSGERAGPPRRIVTGNGE